MTGYLKFKKMFLLLFVYLDIKYFMGEGGSYSVIPELEVEDQN
jgi:hypothetical protein